MRRFVIAALVSTLALSGCDSIGSGDSASITPRNFETARRDAGTVTVEGRTYRVYDIDYRYDDGRTETRRYAMVGSTRVQCTNEDCTIAVQEYLNNERRGEDDHGY